MFGIVFATLKVSANSAVPRTATVKMLRINPAIREIIVPSAMMEEARKRSWLFIARSPDSSNALHYRCQ